MALIYEYTSISLEVVFNHSTFFSFFKISIIWFYPRLLSYLASASWLLKLFWVWGVTHVLSLKSIELVVGNFNKGCATTALAYFAYSIQV